MALLKKTDEPYGKFRKIAREFFYQIKDNTEHKYVGAADTKIVTIDSDEYKLTVDGFWESTDWYEWSVIDSKEELICFGTEFEYN